MIQNTGLYFIIIVNLQLSARSLSPPCHPASMTLSPSLPPLTHPFFLLLLSFISFMDCDFVALWFQFLPFAFVCVSENVCTHTSGSQSSELSVLLNHPLCFLSDSKSHQLLQLPQWASSLCHSWMTGECTTTTTLYEWWRFELWPLCLPSEQFITLPTDWSPQEFVCFNHCGQCVCCIF